MALWGEAVVLAVFLVLPWGKMLVAAGSDHLPVFDLNWVILAHSQKGLLTAVE